MRALLLLISLIIALAANSQQTQRLVVSGNDTIAGWMWNERGDSMVFSRTKKTITRNTGDTIRRQTISNYHYPAKYRKHLYEEAAAGYFSVVSIKKGDTIESAKFESQKWSGFKLNAALDTQLVFHVFNHDTIIDGPFDERFHLEKNRSDTTFIRYKEHFERKYLDEALSIQVSKHDSIYRLKNRYAYFEFKRTRSSWKATMVRNNFIIEYGSNRAQDVPLLIPRYFNRSHSLGSRQYMPDYAYKTYYIKEYEKDKATTYALLPDSSLMKVEDGLIEKMIVEAEEEFNSGYGYCGARHYPYEANVTINHQNDSLLVLNGHTDFKKFFLLNKSDFDYFEPRNCTLTRFSSIQYKLMIKKGKLVRLIVNTEGSQCIVEKAYLKRGSNYFLDDLMLQTIGVNYKVLERKSQSASWRVIGEEYQKRYTGEITIELIQNLIW